MGNSKLQLFYQADNLKIPQGFYSRNGVVTLNKEDWKNAQSQDLLRKVDQWRVMAQLKMSKLSESRSLHAISHIRFPFLMKLDLGSNQISSVQVLSKMWIPTIEEIDLKQNLITQNSCLRKMLPRRPRKISLQKNHILQIAKLSQGSNLVHLTIDCDLDLLVRTKNAVRIIQKNHSSLRSLYFQRILIKYQIQFL